jgi:hypothetical protein
MGWAYPIGYAPHKSIQSDGFVPSQFFNARSAFANDSAHHSGVGDTLMYAFRSSTRICNAMWISTQSASVTRTDRVAGVVIIVIPFFVVWGIGIMNFDNGYWNGLSGIIQIMPHGPANDSPIVKPIESDCRVMNGGAEFLHVFCQSDL